MKTRFSFVILSLLHSTSLWAEEVCATRFEDLDKTPQLQSLKKLLPTEGSRGFVNQTQGSFIYILNDRQKFRMVFYTTGLFDLYGVKREGELIFCDDSGDLKAIGLGQTQKLYIADMMLQFGERLPKQTFSPGDMPEKLQSYHPNHSEDRRDLATTTPNSL